MKKTLALLMFLEVQMGKVIAPQDPITIQIENE